MAGIRPGSYMYLHVRRTLLTTNPITKPGIPLEGRMQVTVKPPEPPPTSPEPSSNPLSGPRIKLLLATIRT
jgi:hypothetical protein